MGPLAGVTVVELAGIGPCPFAAMVMADLGASVIRVERPGAAPKPLEIPTEADVVLRGRKILRLDMKAPADLDVLLRIVEKADVLLEGFRPGVAERLGVGPDVCLERNPRLIYGRMTGFGQDGPLADVAGHDITYAALSGALHASGRAGEAPVPPLNLIADYGGGAMLLLVGVLSALVERSVSGRGQVVDAAMVDGAALLMAPVYGYLAGNVWTDRRGENLLDTGAPFYDTYETADGKHLAIGPLEPRFFAVLVDTLALDPSWKTRQYDKSAWPELRDTLAETFKSRDRAEWEDLLIHTEACVAPVLSLSEAPQNAHLRARRTFIELDGVTQPAPAPRFGRSETATPKAPIDDTAASAEMLRALGIADAAVNSWLSRRSTQDGKA